MPLPYELAEAAPSLVPGALMGPQMPLGEPDVRPHAFLDRLEALGIERVGGELAEISQRHGNPRSGGQALVLLDYENVLQGDSSLRTVLAYWWKMQTGSAVYELADDGSEIHPSQIHRQARFRPAKPKRPNPEDRRYAHEEHVAQWPLSAEDIERWVRSRYWQYAKTAPQNPHSYTHALWGDPAMFARVVQHIREFGGVEKHGRTEYVYLNTSDRKLWSNGNFAASTFLINTKFHDPEDQAQLAEEQLGKPREELGLDIPRTSSVRDGRGRGGREHTPDLFGACAASAEEGDE